MLEPLIIVPAPADRALAGCGALLTPESSYSFCCFLDRSRHQVLDIIGYALGTTVVDSDGDQLGIKMQVVQAIASCGSSLQLTDRHYCIASMSESSQSVRFDQVLVCLEFDFWT